LTLTRLINHAGILLAAMLPILCAGTLRLQAQQGYTARDNQLIVNTREHWEAWSINAGISSITPTGSISPRFQRKQINAALNAPEFNAVGIQGGIITGSNQGQARNLIDGDLNTFWEPDLDHPPEDWWLQIQLGRLVVVEKVVLRFVEEEVGEPFLQFDVLGWRQPPPIGSVNYTLLGTSVKKFWSVFKTDRPNKIQRVFEIVPTTTSVANPEFLGDPLDVIHITVTDSEGDRLREVAPDTYEALPERDKGAIDFFRKGGDRQTLTTRESYEVLAPERQGRIRYYQRERPRLAEVEVWTTGDNLNLGRGLRGGLTELYVSGTQHYTLGKTVTDGSYSSGPSFRSRGGSSRFVEDLGTQFWVDTVQLLTHDIEIKSLEISDGSLALDGSIEWTEVADEGFEGDHTFEIEPARVRYLQVPLSAGNGTLLEVLVYGEGYVAEVALTSDPIELGLHKSLVSIEWDADTPPGTWVEISTQTGDQLRDEFIYHDSDGIVVTEDRYRRRLPTQKQGEIMILQVPHGPWSPWSRPYLVSGEEIKSPLGKYLQIRARVIADTSSKYGPPASLHAIRVNLTDVYADRLVGEVWPRFVDKVGEPEERSVFIRPEFTKSEQNFDEFRITATTATTMELVEVRFGTLENFHTDEMRRFVPSQLEITETGADTLMFRLPTRIRQGVELVEIRLKPTIYGHSAAFETGVKASGTEGSWQKVDTGNAADHVPSETNVVVAVEDNATLTALRIEPPILTPNGDGVNDVATFHFSINRLHTQNEIRLSIYDLSGRLVQQQMEQRADPRGRYALQWKGDGFSGDMVPPGQYLVRIELTARSARAEQTAVTRLVRVAY